MRKRMIALLCIVFILCSCAITAAAADVPKLTCVMDPNSQGGQFTLTGVNTSIYAVHLSITTSTPGEYEFFPSDSSAAKTVKSKTEDHVTTVTVYLDSKTPLDKDANGNIPLGRLSAAKAFTGGGTAELVLVNQNLQGTRYTAVPVTYRDSVPAATPAPTPEPTPEKIYSFEDTKGHWARDSIQFVAEKGLFYGISETIFEPDSPMTRAMFVTVLSRFGGALGDRWKVDCDTPAAFDDISFDKWYAGAVAWAGGTGMVNGIGNNEFGPDLAITREQMAVIIVNFTHLCGISMPEVVPQASFTDAGSISSWAAGAVTATQKAGLLNGRPEGNFDPQATATRAEVATLILRLVEL